jgi:hypothetical protein
VVNETSSVLSERLLERLPLVSPNNTIANKESVREETKCYDRMFDKDRFKRRAGPVASTTFGAGSPCSRSGSASCAPGDGRTNLCQQNQ